MESRELSRLELLARKAGISLDYHDIDGTLHTASDEALAAILSAMGYGADFAAELDRLKDLEGRRILDECIVISIYEPVFRMRLPVEAAAQIELRIGLEGGLTIAVRPEMILKSQETIRGQAFGDFDVNLRDSIPPGQHMITVMRWKEPIAHASLFACPDACYLHPEIEDGANWNGIWLQLYALRSRANWGIGDMGDLLELARIASSKGIRILGLSPLHAPFLMRPDFRSPYSPSSRLYKNPMFLSIPMLPGFASSPRAQELFGGDEFQSFLRANAAEERIDFASVYRWKLRFLEILFDDFLSRATDAASNPGPELNYREEGEGFRDYLEDGGVELERQALFDALEERFTDPTDRPAGFHGWPEAYRDAMSDSVSAFRRANWQRVLFYSYLQYLTEAQFREVSARCLEAGVSLYADLAVGSHPAGAEVWGRKDSFVQSASVGAPPDPFAPQGQDWGLLPLHPRRLVSDRYAPFMELLERNMPDRGLVRIDHVMALCRLYWVVRLGESKEGAYVEYPFQDLLRLAALVSQKKKCMVIGEDLGTVPGYFRAALEKSELFSWKILFFERDGEAFKSPDQYPRRSIATLNTHDLPTFLGWMEGEDIRVREALGLVPSFESEKAMRDRYADIARAKSFVNAKDGATPSDLCLLLYKKLLGANAAIRLVSLYDLFGEEDQPNLPGTTDEYPCWAMKNKKMVYELAEMPLFQAMFNEQGAP